jgi:hypothetical protein
MKVRNMISPQGNPVPHQFIITDATFTIDNQEVSGTAFQSYDSVIALDTGFHVYLDACHWNYSATTSKYRNIFLGEDTATTKKKIASGEYILTDLN